VTSCLALERTFSAIFFTLFQDEISVLNSAININSGEMLSNLSSAIHTPAVIHAPPPHAKFRASMTIEQNVLRIVRRTNALIRLQRSLRGMDDWFCSACFYRDAFVPCSRLHIHTCKVWVYVLFINSITPPINRIVRTSRTPTCNPNPFATIPYRTSYAHTHTHTLLDKKALLPQRWPRDAPIYKLFTLILFTLTATVLCVDFDSERI